MKTMQVTLTGMLLLGLLSGFSPTALSCSTNPCDKEKLFPDIVEKLVECSGSQCDKIPDPIETLAGCESGNCSDAKHSLEILDHKHNVARDPFYWVNCSGSQCSVEEVPNVRWSKEHHDRREERQVLGQVWSVAQATHANIDTLPAA